MFRERNQKKKNIITLILIVWVLVEYCCLPVCAMSALINDNFNATAAESVEQEIIEVIEPIENNLNIIEETNESTININSETQTTVESEVIDEYFDDAQSTKVLAVPKVNTNFKSYTYYTALSRRSIQWKLQEKAESDENGLRKIENYYLAAMGSYYSTTIGDTFRITTDEGNSFDIIICDSKADIHTDKYNMYTKANNCMVEFYVDKTLNKTVKARGSVGILPEFKGSIVKVEYLGFYKWQ